MEKFTVPNIPAACKVLAEEMGMDYTRDVRLASPGSATRAMFVSAFSAMRREYKVARYVASRRAMESETC